MNTTIIAGVLFAGAFIAMLSFEVKLGCILGWLLFAGAMCFAIASILQTE